MKNIDLLPVELTSWRSCEQCGIEYVEVDNIGRLLCSVHPGVKLLNSRGQSYFSCCNRLNAREGCTRIDHTTEKFSYQSIDERFNQIQAFSILVLPCILIPYLYGAPRKDRILFKLPDNFTFSRNVDDTLKFYLPVLDEAMKRFETKLVRDKISYLDAAPLNGEPDLFEIYGGASDELKWMRGTTFSKTQILNSLFETSRQSQLFQQDLSAQDGKKMRGEKECDRIWKNINSKNGDKNKSNIIINFMIVSRIDQTIEV